MSDESSGKGTVAGLLAARAAATPRSPAFQVEAASGNWEPIDWLHFAGRVQRLAVSLHAAGLSKGDRLAIIAPVSLEWELLHHAALACGVVVVGLDAHDLPERIAAMANMANIRGFAVADAQALSRLAAERLASSRILLHLGAAANAPPGPRWLNWTMFEALGNASPAKHAPAAPVGDDIATIIFTSGTTGEPKGIAYSQAQICLAIDAISKAYNFVGSGSRLLCWLPLSNLFQRMVNLAGMRNGASTYLLSDPRRVMDVVASVAPDIFIGVPRFYEKLYDGIRDRIAAQPPMPRLLAQWAWGIGRRTSRRRLAGLRVSPMLALAHRLAERLVLQHVRGIMGKRLRCMVTGSAPTPIHLLEEMHALGWLVLEAYGLSENVLPVAMNRIDDFRFGTVGRPLAGNTVVIAEDGTVKVRGPGLFSGYLGEAAQPPVDGDGFYLTGDLGRFDVDGYLRLTGRADDLIKTSTGRRIAPVVTENLLRSIAGVDEVILVGNGRKYLVALCSCTAASTGTDAMERLGSLLSKRAAEIGGTAQPQGIALIGRPFDLLRGELTPNLKLRRSVIAQNHAVTVERLYRLVDEAIDRKRSYPLLLVSAQDASSPIG